MTPAPAWLLLLVDRNRRAEAYPWLPWKVRLFLLGAGLAVVGMALESRPLVGIAIGVLVLGFAARFLPGGRGTEPGDDAGEARAGGEGGAGEAEDGRRASGSGEDAGPPPLPGSFS